MRAIHRVLLDKPRPAVLLTREVALPFYAGITVAPITRRIRGLAVEVLVGPGNGLDHDSVVNCDDISTVPAEFIGDYLGVLADGQELALTAAIHAAFALFEPSTGRLLPS